MKSTLDNNLTCDGFLDGRLHIWQPRRGYRAGIDPVLLAASVPATDKDTVLELGCGVGVAALCLALRTKARVTGLEIQPEYASLAQKNAVQAGIAFDVIRGDLRAVPTPLKEQSFDHVIANPPYYRADARTKATDTGREMALGEDAALESWVDAGMRRLKPKGRMTIIQRADRLPDLMSAILGRAGDITVLPIASRVGRPAELVIVRARKGARGPFRLNSPFVLHDGAKHQTDADDFTEAAKSILRNGEKLDV